MKELTRAAHTILERRSEVIELMRDEVGKLEGIGGMVRFAPLAR